jgi:VWFA-related protein
VAREQTAKEQATIRTTTQLVQVLLVATDDHGHPYRLLQPSDIKIWDAGQQRSIKMFKLADEDQPRHYEPLPKLGSYSNVRASGKSKLFNAVLLDQVHTDANSWQKASHELKQVITALAADDDVGIYLWTPHGLTLVRRRASSQEGPTLRLKHSDAQRRSSSFAERSDTLQTPERIEGWQGQRLSNVLEAISHDLASLPGRRVLTWFAGDFPDALAHSENPIAEQERLQVLRAVNHLVSEGVAINTVDARGLTPDHAMDADNDGLPVPDPDTTLPYFYPLPHDDFTSVLFYAKQTGGRAFYNSNGIAKSLREASTEAPSRYLIGFYVPDAPDGKLHHIKIQLSEPGIHIRYKPGYLSLPPRSVSSAELELATALKSPFASDAIALQANAVAETDGSLSLTLYVDPTKLGDVGLDNHRQTTLYVIYGQTDSAGRTFAVPPLRIPMSFTTKSWLTTKTRLLIRPSSDIVRVVVLDELSGNLGALDIPLAHASR